MTTPTKDDSMDVSSSTDKSSTKTNKPNPILAKVIAQLAQDDFEEFEAFPTDSNESGAGMGHDEPAINVWEDNWDDESAETDFSKQLKEELAKHGHLPSQ